MIRLLLLTLISVVGLVQVNAQGTKELSLPSLFAKCAQIEGIDVVHLTPEDFNTLFKTGFLQEKSSILSGISLLGDQKSLDPSAQLSGSLSVISVESMEQLPPKKQKLLKKLFETTSFVGSELITFVKEDGETVRVYAHGSEKDKNRAFYIISTADNEYNAICLKGLFGIKSHVQVTPEQQK